MSRRIATDTGGKRGPQSSRLDNPGPSRRDDRNDYQNQRPGSSSNNHNQQLTGGPPGMPNFPMNFPTLPNGMPMFPGGFPFPFPPQQQNKQE